MYNLNYKYMYTSRQYNYSYTNYTNPFSAIIFICLFTEWNDIQRKHQIATKGFVPKRHYTTCRMYHVPQMSHAPAELLYGLHGLMQRGIPHTVKSSDCQIKHFLLILQQMVYTILTTYMYICTYTAVCNLMYSITYNIVRKSTCSDLVKQYKAGWAWVTL